MAAEMAVEALLKAHPMKNPILVEHNTTATKMTKNMKNLSTSADRPTAKYTQEPSKIGKIN